MHQKRLAGERIGGLKVLRLSGTVCGETQWVCLCDCGRTVVMKLGQLRNRRRSTAAFCGQRCPLHIDNQRRINQTHGLWTHPAYAAYQTAKGRCTNPRDPAFRWYGARGIHMCRSWLRGFSYFWADMGRTWKRGLTLDRTDNNSGYRPSNCRWVSMQENQCNRRSSLRYKYPGIPAGHMGLMRRWGVNKTTVYRRLRNGETWAAIEARYKERKHAK